MTDRFRGREGVWEERNDDLRDGVGALARSECESSTRKRRSNATTTLAAHPPLALCAYLYIRTCMHGRPIILFSSLILFQIHFDRFPTCFPSSTRKIVSFEKSREKLDGFDRWFSSFFFFFRFLEFSSRTKATGRVDEGGGEVKLDE